VINGASNATATVQAGSYPANVAVNSFTHTICAVNIISGNVTVINGKTNATSTVQAGSSADELGINSQTNMLLQRENVVLTATRLCHPLSG